MPPSLQARRDNTLAVLNELVKLVAVKAWMLASLCMPLLGLKLWMLLPVLLFAALSFTMTLTIRKGRELQSWGWGDLALLFIFILGAGVLARAISTQVPSLVVVSIDMASSLSLGVSAYVFWRHCLATLGALQQWQAIRREQ